MEPTQPSPLPPESESSPKPKSPKKALVAGIIIVSVLLLAIIIGLIFNSMKGGSGTSSDSSLYYDRPGYPRASLNATIGDPLAITFTAKKEAQELSDGSVVIPACSIISPADLERQGLKLQANDFGYPVTQNYISKSGKASFAPDLNRMPSSDETLGCNYGLTDKKSVYITVNQAFTVDKDMATKWISTLNYTPQSDIEGYKLYQRTQDSTGSYMLSKGTNFIQLDIDVKDEKKNKALLAAAVANLNNFSSKPQGVSDITVKSPTFTQSYAKSCDLLTNDDMKNLSGNDMSPLVQERWTTATGVIDYSKVSNYKEKTNYTRNECIRVANDPEYITLVGNRNHDLRVTAATYENEEAASLGLFHVTVGGDEKATKLSDIGKEAFAYVTPKDKQNAVAFRQGRVVIELVYDFALQDQDPATADLSSYTKKLEPAAKAIAAKLKSL